MKCIKENCEKRKCCEKVHSLNGYELGKDEIIMIPNEFYFELNLNNRLAKRGIPENGFEFGCMKLLGSENEGGSLYIDNDYVTDFEFVELIDCCNNAFREMIANGTIKIG